jgi:hypothetical protein
VEGIDCRSQMAEMGGYVRFHPDIEDGQNVDLQQLQLPPMTHSNHSSACSHGSTAVSAVFRRKFFVLEVKEMWAVFLLGY